MEFTTENVNDIQKYYAGTFVKIAETGDKLYYIQYVNRAEVRGVVEDGSEFVIYLDNENPFSMGYVLPHKSFFQYGDDAYQLYRIPAKQYQRGLNGANTKISRIGSDGKSEYAAEMGFDVLKAFVTKQKFAKLSEAIKGKARSQVLSPRMFYFGANKGIYIDFMMVAKVVANKIHLYHNIFKPEIQELLQATNEHNQFTFV